MARIRRRLLRLLLAAAVTGAVAARVLAAWRHRDRLWPETLDA